MRFYIYKRYGLWSCICLDLMWDIKITYAFGQYMDHLCMKPPEYFSLLTNNYDTLNDDKWIIGGLKITKVYINVVVTNYGQLLIYCNYKNGMDVPWSTPCYIISP